MTSIRTLHAEMTLESATIPPMLDAPDTAVLAVNLGTPETPTAPAVRRYLAEFLSDPRVVSIPALLWQPPCLPCRSSSRQ